MVVPAPRGVQPLAGVANALGEDGLDIHMNIFVVHGELHFTSLNVRQDGLQAADDLIRFCLLDDALLAQHGGVGDGAGDVLLIQAGVEVDGRIKIIDQGIGLFLEPSSPKFHNVSLLIGLDKGIAARVGCGNLLTVCEK